MKRILASWLVLWLCMGLWSEHTLDTRETYLERKWRRQFWRQQRRKSQTIIFPGCEDWRRVIEILLCIGGVEKNPGPTGTLGVLTKWTHDDVDWAFTQTNILRKEDTLMSWLTTFVKLFVPGSPGSRIVLVHIQKVMDDIAKVEAASLTRAQLFALYPEATVVGDMSEAYKLRIVMGHLRRALPASAETHRDRLRKCVRERAEPLNAFLERFIAQASLCSEVNATEAKRILFAKLPPKYQEAASQCEFTCSLSEMVTALRRRMQWAGILDFEGPRNRGGNHGDSNTSSTAGLDPLDDPMDIDATAFSLRDKLLDGSRIRFDHITSKQGVMVAWKHLMNEEAFRREALQFLRRPNPSRRPGFPARPVRSRFRGHNADECRAPEVEWIDSHDADEWEELPLSDEPIEYGRVALPDPNAVLDAPGASSSSSLNRESQEALPHYGMAHVREEKDEVMCCRSVRTPASSLYVPMDLFRTQGRNSLRVQSLIDTGATHNFIQLRLVRTLGMEHDMVACQREVVYGNGQKERLQGMIRLPVKVNNQHMLLDAYVISGKGPSVILGYSFLRGEGLLVDCRRRRLLREDSTGAFVECRLHQAEDAQPTLTQLAQRLEEVAAQVTSLAHSKN